MSDQNASPHDPFGASHLAFISVNLNPTTTVFVPPIYRHMPKEFVDQFWETGRLRVSNYLTFRANPDEHQGDKEEGTARHFVVDHENNRTLAFTTTEGNDTLVLSATTLRGANLPAAFGDAWFEIVEPLGFANEIALNLPGCLEAGLGACMYVEQKLLHTKGKTPTAAEMTNERGDFDRTKFEATVHRGPRQLFLKDKRFADQFEFRILWKVAGIASAPVVIEAPTLRKFCRPMDRL